MTRIRRLADSYRTRLIAGYVVVTIIFSAAWLWSLYGPLTQAVLTQQQGNLRAVAQAGALVLADSNEPAQSSVEQLVARTDLRMTIVGADGIVRADSLFDVATMDNHGGRPEVAEALQGRVGTARRVSETEGDEQLYVAVPALLDGERVALRVSQPLSQIEGIAASSRRVGLLLLALAAAVASLVAAWAARAAAEPVSQLTGAAERMALGELSTRIPEVPADLDVLAQALSSLRAQMRSRLEALESEKRTLAAAVDGLTDAVLVLDGDVIELANRRASELFKSPAGGWRGTALADSGLPASLLETASAQVARREPAAIEVGPDPTGCAYRLVVSPLAPKETEGRRSIVVIGDITERARLERMRRDFVANASHELKTPVSGIRLLAQATETASADGEVDQALRFARQIEAETERLQRLVGDLLDLSRLEAAPEPDAITDLRLAVDNAVVSHRAAAERKGLALVTDVADVRGLDVFARADATDVAIGLDNLLDNAIAYTEQGSVTVRLEASDEEVAIVVSDSGPGIDAEHLPRIFERFYRVDRGRSRESGGTGLGLSLVRHVAERSGGSVSVQSQAGQGSAFTLRLPRAT